MFDTQETEQRALQVALVWPEDGHLTDSQALLIDRLCAEPGVRLVGKMRGLLQPRNNPIPLAVRAWLNFERLLLRHRIISYDKGDALACLGELPVIEPGNTPVQCDVAIALGDVHLPQAQLGMIRHGQISVNYSGTTDPDLAGVTSAVAQNPNILVDILLRTAQNPEPACIRRAAYNPKPGAVLTGAFVEEKVVLLILRVLQDLRIKQDMPAGKIALLPRPSGPTMPEFSQYLRRFARKVTYKLSERFRERINSAKQRWQIVYGESDLLELDPSKAQALPETSQIMADPFLFEHGTETWVFYEAMNADGKNGWIEAAQLVGGTCSTPVTALKCPYHLSFPYVFREGEDIFMIPETHQQKRLEIWKAVHFPTEWVLHKTAFEGQYLAETSLFRNAEGQWWLLTNISDHYAFQDHSSELYLFSVDGPDLNTIVPHRGNPVVIGSDVARNAGAIICQNGRMFRPSQNNSYGIYGYGLNIMEITRFEMSDYEECLVKAFTPEDLPGSSGIHHLSAMRDKFVLDWCEE